MPATRPTGGRSAVAGSWPDILPARDRQAMLAAGYGVKQGFGRRPALLIVDVSYGFAGGPRAPVAESVGRWPNACGEQAWDAIEVIGSLLEVAWARRLPIIYTTGSLRPDKWDAGGWLWKNPRLGEADGDRREGPDADTIVELIAPRPQDIVVLKQKPSAFFGTSLLSHLILLGCDSLIVAGATTSGCVRATVVDAFSNNLRVAVAADGCFDRAQLSHAVSLADMNAKYADVITAAEAAQFLSGLPDDLFADLPSGRGGGSA